LAWLTLLPMAGFLPHISQIRDMIELLPKKSVVSKPKQFILQAFFTEKA